MHERDSDVGTGNVMKNDILNNFLCKKRPFVTRRTDRRETLDSGARHLKCATRFTRTILFPSHVVVVVALFCSIFALSTSLSFARRCSALFFLLPSTWMSFVSLFSLLLVPLLLLQQQQLPRSDGLSLCARACILGTENSLVSRMLLLLRNRERKNPRTTPIRNDE